MAQNPSGRTNQTAYRVLLLLQWLNDTPLSVEDINQRFLQHPDVGRQVSQDSIWLYINTLRSIGCQISRPSSSNGYTYQMTYHPFAHFLTQEHLSCLQAMVHVFDNEPDCGIVVPFHRWLHRVLQTASNTNREDMARQFFDQMRLLDLTPITPLIVDLMTYCLHGQLIEIAYPSRGKPLDAVAMLPVQVIHYDGRLYLTGVSSMWDEMAMLRLDRIESVWPIEDAVLLEQLSQKKAQFPSVKLRLYHCSPEQYMPFTAQDAITSYDHSQHILDVCVPGDNLFLLKQKLLASGLVFDVLSPQAFRHDMQNTLEQMKAIYEQCNPVNA